MAVFGGARGLAQAFLRSAATKGIKFADVFKSMQDAGMSTYRRTNMLKDYRQFAGIADKADLLKFVRKDMIPSHSLYTTTTGYQRTKFRYQLNVDVYKPLTNETFSMPTNIASDVPLTPGQIEEAGIDSVRGGIDRSEFDIVGYRPYAAFVQEGVFWD